MTADRPPCRSCGGHGLEEFLSLGSTPLADALVRPDQVDEPEARFPLDLAFCPDCTLVQILEEVAPDRLFVDNYLYFSSFSDELREHARTHALGLIDRRKLGPDSLVVELASNDGYLLRNFVDKGVPVLGIDPAPDQAAEANANGIPTLSEFFGSQLAAELVSSGKRADVIIANNVMAHVPDLNGFVAGISTLLAPDGIATIENPYVRHLVDHREFDTIYHEHFCYFSCTSVAALAGRHGLQLVDVEEFPDLHGGTLRWTLAHSGTPTDEVVRRLDEESRDGLTRFSYYQEFSERVAETKRDLLALLDELKASGATIAAYGAAAKGSTMLNHVGVGTDLVEYVVDRNVHKQGLLMPGTHQPIHDPAVLLERQPDYVLLLAWNFAGEICRQQSEYRARGGQFIVPVPAVEVLS